MRYLQCLVACCLIASNVTAADDVASPELDREMAISAITKADPDAIIERDASGNVSEILVRGPGVNDKLFAHLKAFPEATSVLVANSEVTDAGLAHLKGMTKLTTLAICGSQISDAGLIHLGGLVNLRILALSECNIAGSKLVHLKNLALLEELNLCATEVTDAKLLQLAGLTKLKSLSLDGYWITDAGASALKKILPDVTITLNKDIRLKLLKESRENQRKRRHQDAKAA